MRRRGFGQPSPGRLLFVAFDVVALAGEDVMARRWDARRAMLVDLGLDGPAWCTTPSYPGEGAALFEATRAQGIEGVVAKRLDAPYRPGVRTRAWVKTKHFDRARFDVLGVAPTPEGRYALLLGPAQRRSAGCATPGGWNGASPGSGFEELVARGPPDGRQPASAARPAGGGVLRAGGRRRGPISRRQPAPPCDAAVAGLRARTTVAPRLGDDASDRRGVQADKLPLKDEPRTNRYLPEENGQPVPPAVEAPMAENELLTPGEVATMFRVNPKTVTRWARAGKISAVRTLGGHRRFRASEIRRFLEEVQDAEI